MVFTRVFTESVTAFIAMCTVCCIRCVCLIICTLTHKNFAHHVPCAYVRFLLHAAYMFMFPHRDDDCDACTFFSLRCEIKIIAFKLDGFSIRRCGFAPISSFSPRRKFCWKSSMYYKAQTPQKHFAFNLHWITIQYDSVLVFYIPFNAPNANIWPCATRFCSPYFASHFWVSVHFSNSHPLREMQIWIDNTHFMHPLVIASDNI